MFKAHMGVKQQKICIEENFVKSVWSLDRNFKSWFIVPPTEWIYFMYLEIL